jgi:hypothetical protein
MAISPHNIRLTPAAIRDFGSLADLIDQFPLIDSAVHKAGPQPSVSYLAKIVSAATNLPNSSVQEFIRALLNFHDGCQNFKCTPAEFFDAVTGSIKSINDENATGGGTTTDLISTLDTKRQAIISAVESLSGNSVFLTTKKAGRLAFAHQSVLKDVQLITDLRPVFSDDASAIVEAILTHSLVIEYFDGATNRLIEMTLDAKDVAKLKLICIRAEQKALTAKDAFQVCNWTTSIFGEIDAE